MTDDPHPSLTPGDPGTGNLGDGALGDRALGDGALGDGFDRDDLGGHSIEELSDYLDAGREPRDPSIENSPAARIALDALIRLRDESWAMLEVRALADPGREPTWIATILEGISLDAKAGRDIPLNHPDPTTHLNITEGSVRGLIRAAGDRATGAIMGKVILEGDVEVPGEPITVGVTASVTLEENLLRLADRIRANIAADLQRHTELNVVAINVTIQDVHSPRPAGDAGAAEVAGSAGAADRSEEGDVPR